MKIFGLVLLGFALASVSSAASVSPGTPLSAAAAAELKPELVPNEGRILFNDNGTGAVYFIIVLGAIILAGIAKYLAIAYYYVENKKHSGGYKAPPRNDAFLGDELEQSYDEDRSAQDNFDFNSMNVIQWISMLQELYEKFDYKDLDCQKRLICEVMKEPEYFGTVATQIKNGFQYAKYLEVLSLPDDMRETLDEYMEANSRAEGQKDCTEYFQCPYSLKESVKKNWEGNSL